MIDSNLLLTDEFVAFSTKIGQIHELKKKKLEEMKEIYDKFQAEIAALDKQAKDAQNDFETWSKSRAKS